MEPYQDVHIENSVFHTQRGFTCVEADGIQLKNVTLQTDSADPAIHVLNSRNLVFDGVEVSGKAEKALKIEGKQTGAIRLLGTNFDARGIEFGLGVPPTVLIKK